MFTSPFAKSQLSFRRSESCKRSNGLKEVNDGPKRDHGQVQKETLAWQVREALNGRR